MYYDFWVGLPDSNGKFVFEKHGETTYVKYEIDRVYDSQKQITYPKRVTIGKLSEDRTKIRPNGTLVPRTVTRVLRLPNQCSSDSCWIFSHNASDDLTNIE